MIIHNLSLNNSIINTYLKEIRSVEIQQDSMRFRQNIERVGELIAYEISKTLHYKSEEVVTPLGTSTINIYQDNIILMSVLRAALPFHNGFQRLFDKAGSAFISAYRQPLEAGDFKINVEYFAAPDLTGKTVILVDPAIATGGSLLAVYHTLLTHGTPKKVIIAGLISSEYGLKKLEEELHQDNVELWTAAIDPSLNENSYIVPGFGDAGDLAFGTKL